MSSLDNISRHQVQALKKMEALGRPATARELRTSMIVFRGLQRRKLVNFMETPGDYRHLDPSRVLIWYITARGKEYLRTGIYQKAPEED